MFSFRSLVPKTPQSAAHYSNFLPDNRAFPTTPQSVNSTPEAIRQWDTPLSEHRSSLDNVHNPRHELSTPSSLIGTLSLGDRQSHSFFDDDTLGANNSPISENYPGSNIRPTSPAPLSGMEGDRLPSLFGMTTSSTELFDFPPVNFASGSTLDLGPAPRGPSKTGWLWLYFCDMAAGFEACQRFRGDGMSTAAAFALAFPGHVYVRATFSENHIPFKKVGRYPAIVQRWKSYGRESPGLWASFREEWRNKVL